MDYKLEETTTFVVEAIKAAIELENQEATIKWKLKKAKTFEEIELEKERLQIPRDAEDVKIMLADESILDENAKKRLAEKKNEINNRRAWKATKDAATTDHEARMQAEQATRMQAEMVA
ncbi:hypothetical protein D1007_19529 [Hordeum vulgare]|nr:hypothetical protein D1007_19529 [Hordeum vulgare]